MRATPICRFAMLATVALLSACGGEELGPIDPTLGNERLCTAEDLRRGCRLGTCTLQGAADDGSTVRLRRTPILEELRGDALEPELCELVDPPSATLTVAIRTAEPPTAEAALFVHHAKNDDVLLPSAVVGETILASTTAPGVFGATRRPSALDLESVARFQTMSSETTAALARNLTGQNSEAVFYDGTHLFLGSGNRLLIFNRFPENATARPDVVLGQPNLDTQLPGTSASLWNLPVSAVWSDGTRLMVGNRNRILVYGRIPTESFAPADLVLGQPDFSTNVANFGGLSGATLSHVSDIQSDGTRFYVSDLLNSRILVWERFPTQNGEPAAFAIGQPSLTSAAGAAGATPITQAWGSAVAANGLFVASLQTGTFFLTAARSANPPPAFSVIARGNASATPTTVTLPNSIALLPGGGLLIGDSSGNRIGVLRATPTALAPRLDFALGQVDLDRTSFHPTSSSSARFDARVSISGGKVFVGDGSRVHVYDHAPAYAFDPADRTLGHPSGATSELGVDYARIGEGTLAAPADVSVRGAQMAIADRANHRVLLVDTSQPGRATVVVGQESATAFLPNRGTAVPRADGLNGPAAVLLDGTKLYVADTANHRVLVWNRVPTASGTAADLVLGQDDFVHGRPNHGALDVDADGRSDCDARGFFEPTDLETDGTRLFVVDRVNHRVLVWDAAPTQNGQAASRVLGQLSFTANVANRGAGALAVAPDGFNLPTTLVRDAGALWIADTDNNRVVRWENVATTPTTGRVVGQADGTTVSNPNYFVGGANSGLSLVVPASRDTLVRPRGLTLVNRTLAIAEQATHRIHFVNADTGATTGILGQPTDTSASANAGTLDAGSLSAPWGLSSDRARLYVADEANHRVLGFDAAALAIEPRGARAQWLFGQATYQQNGFNRSAAKSAGGGRRPRAIALDGDRVFVAEADANRVVAYDAKAIDTGATQSVFGQPDADLRLANSGGAPSARTLRGPRGVHAAGGKLFVADSGNHRVLAFDPSRPSSEATMVIGQADFASAEANRGGAPSASTLKSPEGVYFDGERLFVADTGNHRVLVWNQLPTASGAPADAVLGQATATVVLANRGESGASEATLDLPSYVLATSTGAIWIADTGNNRVVRYATATTGSVAELVLGQSSPQTRTPASSAQDRQRLAGPVALASDGVSLFVADRDGARVAVYPKAATTVVPASLVLDGAGGIRVGNASGLAAARASLFTTRLYVVDPVGEQLVVVGPLSRLTSAAAP